MTKRVRRSTRPTRQETSTAAIYATETFYSSNRVTEGLDYLEGLIVARTVAGLDVPQAWYGNGLTHARDLGDAGRIGHWAGSTPRAATRRRVGMPGSRC